MVRIVFEKPLSAMSLSAAMPLLGGLRHFNLTRNLLASLPKLSPHDVNEILRANEFTQELSGGSVKSFDSNQLASNNPMEDTRNEANCLLTEGLLVGVYDGHGGAGCAQVVGKRLLQYIAASLVPPDLLHSILGGGDIGKSLLTSYNDKVEFVEEVRTIYRTSFSKFVDELITQPEKIFGTKLNNSSSSGGFNMSKAMETAFLRLDQDMSQEALSSPSPRTLSVAMSGCVACVAHIDGAHLHIASAGDASAVLGFQTDTGRWSSKKLNNEHNSENVSEVRRLLGEHPSNERDTVIRHERLLGQLAPLRSLGDFRYKWARDILQEVVLPSFGSSAIPPNYHTPPYLTSKPDITHHRLTPRDKFLVIASDGLWDLMTPDQVVRLVGEHMSGKAFLTPLRLPKKNMKFEEINKLLEFRRKGLTSKPLDRNAATHLLRNALGGSEYGVEHSKLSHLLSLPQDVVRLFRDDITVTIVYFDSEFLRTCPP